MNLMTGATYKILIVGVSTGENIYKVINENNTNDAFVCKLEDGIKENTIKLTLVYIMLHGSLSRCQSLYDDKMLKNTKN